jgi:hypothetical protein
MNTNFNQRTRVNSQIEGNPFAQYNNTMQNIRNAPYHQQQHQPYQNYNHLNNFFNRNVNVNNMMNNTFNNPIINTMKTNGMKNSMNLGYRQEEN